MKILAGSRLPLAMVRRLDVTVQRCRGVSCRPTWNSAFSENCTLDTLYWAAKTGRERNTGAAWNPLEAMLNVLPSGVAASGRKKPDASLSRAANDFEALERLRRLAF